MPIQSTHELYDQYAPHMKRTRDAVAGNVKHYVPKLAGQTPQEYETYTNRSNYFNVVERTLAALTGALTRREHTITGIEPVFVNGVDTDEFILNCYIEIFTTGRTGLLVDFDDVNNTPYTTSYSGEAIINWSKDFVILAEPYFDADPRDKYKQIMLMRYRELFIDDNGFYAVNIWEQKRNRYGNFAGKAEYEIVETIEPSIRGMRLTYIPFVVVNSNGVGIEYITRPPLDTMAGLNIDHFITSVDTGHAIHKLAVPTPWIAGDLQGDSQSVALGTNQIIHLTQGSSCGWLEFSGAGVQKQIDWMNMKEAQMYSLGSRMLQYKKGVEASDSLQIRLGAEGASLVGVAIALEEGLEQAFNICNMWSGVGVEVEVELNKDVSPSIIDPQQVASLLALYQQNIITLDTLLQRLYEGEIVDSVEEEKEMLAGTEPVDNPIEEVQEMEGDQ